MTLRSFANAITAYVPVSVISPRYLLRKSQLQIFKLTKLSVAQIEQHWTLYNINCHLKFAEPRNYATYKGQLERQARTKQGFVGFKNRAQQTLTIIFSP